MDITINAPDLGESNGTVSQTLDYLQSVELHIKNNSRGNICLYARSTDGQFDEIVAMYAPDADGRIKTQYVDHGGGYFAPSPGRSEATVETYGKSFFCPLTPAAWGLVESFLNQCVDALKAAIETDGLGHFYSIKIEID